LSACGVSQSLSHSREKCGLTPPPTGRPTQPPVVNCAAPMICPQCHAEYREGFTVCADCDVSLAAQLPLATQRPEQSATSGPDDPFDDAPQEDPFCAFWEGDDSRIHADLCSVLEDAGIPTKTVRREEHLFRLSARSALKIGVPFSLYEKAEAAVKEAFGSDEDGSDAVPLLSAPPQDDTGGRDASGAAATAEPDLDPKNFFAEDATSQVWRGEDLCFADFLVSCLHTNDIHCRLDKSGCSGTLYVLPANELRAREIVHEVVDATPPE